MGTPHHPILTSSYTPYPSYQRLHSLHSLRVRGARRARSNFISPLSKKRIEGGTLPHNLGPPKSFLQQPGAARGDNETISTPHRHESEWFCAWITGADWGKTVQLSSLRASEVGMAATFRDRRPIVKLERCQTCAGWLYVEPALDGLSWLVCVNCGAQEPLAATRTHQEGNKAVVEGSECKASR